MHQGMTTKNPDTLKKDLCFSKEVNINQVTTSFSGSHRINRIKFPKSHRHTPLGDPITRTFHAYTTPFTNPKNINREILISGT